MRHLCGREVERATRRRDDETPLAVDISGLMVGGKVGDGRELAALCGACYISHQSTQKRPEYNSGRQVFMPVPTVVNPMEATMAVLMVRATGMLAETAIGLAKGQELVHLVSRDRSRFENLQTQAGAYSDFLHWYAADYTESAALRAALESAWGIAPYSRVVLWGSDPNAFSEITMTVARLAGNETWRLYFVRGSQYWNTDPPPVPPTCSIRLVILGFVWEGSERARWLTPHEISLGVLEAVRTDSPYYVVGTVTPWDRRPSW